MQIKSDALPNHLQRNPQWQLALISGDEPFLILDAEKTLKNTIDPMSLEEVITLDVDAKFNWELFYNHINSLSLFSTKKLIQLRFINKIDAKSQKQLQTYASNINADITLLIRCPKLETSALKSTWLKSLDKSGLIIICYPPTYERLPQFIQNRAKSKRITLDSEAIQFLAVHDEGNLLAIEQELDRLQLLFGNQKITKEAVKSVIADNAKFNVFDFSDALLKGDIIRIKRILDTLKLEGEEPILVNWALQREIHTLLHMHIKLAQGADLQSILQSVWTSKKAIYQKALQRTTLEKCREFMEMTILIDRSIKGNFKENPWNAILRLSFAIAGHKLLTLGATLPTDTNRLTN